MLIGVHGSGFRAYTGSKVGMAMVDCADKSLGFRV